MGVTGQDVAPLPFIEYPAPGQRNEHCASNHVRLSGMSGPMPRTPA
jgi:hypothetical protein